MTPRRVLHVLATAQEQGASISRMVRAFAQTVDPQRYRLEAWFLGGDGPLAAELREAGVAVRTFTWNADRHDLAGAWRFWRSLRRDPFPIVHLHVGGRAVPFLVRSALRTKILLHLHYTGAEAGSAGPIRVRVWMADQVVALSRAVALKVVGAKPRVIYYGIQVPEQRPRRPPETGDDPVMGAASRLVRIKGIVYLLRAVAHLRREFPGIRLEIAGAGPEEEPLRREANALGLGECVTFLEWQTNVWPLLARWDIFVQPSLEEGFGMAALEAMAAGLPVVGTSTGGLPELIEDGCTGYVVPPADALALAGRLRDLLTHPARRRAMGAAARARVRERFSAERMAAEISAIYDEVLSARGS